MNPRTIVKSPARRSFLRLLGGVVAGGAGAVALGTTASAQPTTHTGTGGPAETHTPTESGKSTDGTGVTACAIWCSLVCCNCCNGTNELWHCVAGPCGYDFYRCQNGSCASYCLSQSAC